MNEKIATAGSTGAAWGGVRSMVAMKLAGFNVATDSEMSMKHFGSYRMTNPILVGMALAWGLLPLKKGYGKGSVLRGDAKDALELGFKSKALSEFK